MRTRAAPQPPLVLPKYTTLRPRLLARAAYLGPVALHKVASALELAQASGHSAEAARNVCVADLCAQLGMDCDTVCAAALAGIVGVVGVRAVEAAVGSGVLTILETYDAIEEIVLRAEDARFNEASYANLRELVLLAARDEHRALSLRLAAVAVEAREPSVDPGARALLARRSMYLDAPLANQLGMWYLQSELEEGAFRHLLPREYDDIKRKLAVRLRESPALLDVAKADVETVLARGRVVRAAVSRARVVCRVKGAYSVYRKMQRSGKSLAEVYDVLALRVIVVPKRGGGDAEECAACYAVADAIRAHYTVLESREKDYLVQPKSNGYRSLHLTVLAGRQPLEVQIRTEKMHHVAEFGAAAHWLYKGEARELPEFSFEHAAAACRDRSAMLDHTRIQKGLPYLRPRIPAAIAPAADADAKRRSYVSHIASVIRQTRVIVKSCDQLYTLTVGSTLSDLLAGLGNASIGAVAVVNGSVAPLTQRLEMNDIVRFAIPDM